jgi:hypothetical protein
VLAIVGALDQTPQFAPSLADRTPGAMFLTLCSPMP